MSTPLVVIVTDELVAELEHVAKRATKGEWWIDSHGHTMVSHDSGITHTVFQAMDIVKPAVRHPETGNLSHWPNDWDASYIATANPAKILALLAERAELRRVIADVKWRVADTTDQLQATGFDGDRRYGLDEWSGPIKNLNMAIGILEKSLEPNK